MSDFILPTVEIRDDSMRRNERVLHNGLLDHLRESYPRMRIQSEPYWGPGVGRPDIVCYTDLPAGLGLALTVIEIKRPLATDAAFHQLARYYLFAARWLQHTKTRGTVTAILAAPRLLLEKTHLSEELLYLPLEVV